MEMYRRTFAEVNLDHLSENFDAIKKIAGADRFICPMVKANAYGHGDIQVAQHLENEGATHMGVCLIEEGLLLRQHHVQSDILVFRGFDKEGAQKIYDAQLTPVVSTWEQIKALEDVVDDVCKIHLKINTGMNRLGFAPHEAEKLRDYFRKSKKLKLKAILSHFYNGEDAWNENADSAKQTKILTEVFDFFKSDGIYAHLLNSGGIMSYADSRVQQNKNHYLHQYQWGFRPGLMLYGYSPDQNLKAINLKPVMTFKSVVNNIRIVEPNEVVSYGAKWRAKQRSIIAVVPVGYADGVHRLVAQSGYALFAGKKVPVIGAVCMDFLMLDVTNVITENEIHKYSDEEVIIFGYDQQHNFLSAEEMAKAVQTITWEVLTAVGERVPRHFKGGAR